jgi:hypothetical protein
MTSSQALRRKVEMPVAGKLRTQKEKASVMKETADHADPHYYE